MLSTNPRVLPSSLIGLLIGLILLTLSAAAQTTAAYEWTWVGGSNTGGQPGVYDTLGSPAVGSTPGGRNGSHWTDSSGNLWFFGGYGYDADGNEGYLNDLWKFNSAMGEWAWMGGSNTVPACSYPNFCGNSGVYGALGTPALGNIPGGRNGGATWVDSGGNLWLFGGYGYDANGDDGYLNDLWVYNPATSLWTWEGGSNTYNAKGVYGTLGSPAAGNIPGACEFATTWVDNSGNLWLFGGFGYDGSGSDGELNDMWVFNPSTKQWTWMGGSSTTADLPGVYGRLGTPASGNLPGGRDSSSSWTDSSGNFWLFGGQGFVTSNEDGDLNVVGDLNDVWEFNPSTKLWAWMGGSSTAVNQSGVYGTLGTPASGNLPGSRYSSSRWTDNNGNFWLFGGRGISGSSAGGFLNDLWEFNPSTMLWTWMGGSNSVPKQNSGFPGVYGMLGTPAASNIPGGRYYSASWKDASGHLWLFGAFGFDANGNSGLLNDLWEYQPNVSNPVPVIGSISPAYASAGSSAFTLTVKGSGFISSSTVYWGTTALSTTYGSATQLTALVPASDIATANTAYAITVQTPTPGGGTSAALTFEVDSAGSGSTAPGVTTVTATVNPGSSATYSVTLPSTVESATVSCLNLPQGAGCSYSGNTVTISTSASTPAGTYQITIVFSETVSGAASSWILLPFLLLPLMFMRKRLAARGAWITACLTLVLLAGAAVACSGCGGGSTTTTQPAAQSHQVASSATVSLTVQ